MARQLEVALHVRLLRVGAVDRVELVERCLRGPQKNRKKRDNFSESHLSRDLTRTWRSKGHKNPVHLENASKNIQTPTINSNAAGSPSLVPGADTYLAPSGIANQASSQIVRTRTSQNKISQIGEKTAASINSCWPACYGGVLRPFSLVISDPRLRSHFKTMIVSSSGYQGLQSQL